VTPTPSQFLVAHLPASDTDARTLATDLLLEGGALTDGTARRLRRDAFRRKAIHLPALLIAAVCAMVIMDLSASGYDPFNTWPVQSTVAVISGWVAGIAYLGTFQTPQLKAFRRCRVVPVGFMAPCLPGLLSEIPDARAKLAEALGGRGLISGGELDYDEAQKQLRSLTASLR